MNTLVVKNRDILTSTGVVVQLAPTYTTTTTGAVPSLQGSSTTVQPTYLNTSHLEATVQALPLSREVIFSYSLSLDLYDRLAVADALSEPGVESYEQVRRELGLD